MTRLERQCAGFNKACPPGTPVAVTRDNGNVIHTKTRGTAYVLSGHTAVVFVEGISGCYLLERVKPEQPREEGEI